MFISSLISVLYAYIKYQFCDKYLNNAKNILHLVSVLYDSSFIYINY
jgi:hypothetical protein